MTASTTLSVKVRKTADEFEVGVIRYDTNDVTIELESGEIFSGKKSGNTIFDVMERISLDNESRSIAKPIEENVEVLLKPTLVIHHPYTESGGQIVEDVFPPSTSGFYGRLLNGRSEALYFVQKVKNSNQFWLTITSPRTSKIFENLLIQPYEAEAISLIDDYRIKRISPAESEAKRTTDRNDILSVLDSPAPTWQELSMLVKDVSIPSLQMGKTMRETLTQVVPASFPDSIRDELMAFLAYVIQNTLPREDPLTYLARFSSTTVLESLIQGHLMHLTDKTDWPSYVKLMILAARGHLESPKRAVSDSILSAPWFVYVHKCAELLPSWLNIAVKSARNLNESKRLILGLPTTRSAARRARTAWKRRFAEMSYDLMARGYVDTSALGLVELVYLGAAYRWPHRHMKFITRLGVLNENPPHLQVMLLPLKAAERVRRALPGVLSVFWSARSLNLDLFNERTNSWDIPVEQIIESLEKKSTFRKLMNRFGGRGTSDMYTMSKGEARVVDLFSEGVILSSLETPGHLVSLGLEKREIRGHLKNLINHNIIRLMYEVSDPKLITLAVILQGEKETVTSVISEFLTSTPTTFARLDETGESGVLLSRLPEESAQIIASQLTSRAIAYGANIRCMRPTAFRGYTSNLYQRLLKPDGTWDDDVSAFLSQARSKRKELSE
ncbi:MAG: hypothetical protein EAX87_13245, partial [Candidatus Thorarchaeota archaeon]|nr:hypothetical protein [Candidatus Thorarchaeota archaeon]